MSFSHTILGEGDTWRHLGWLTVMSFLTMGIVYFTGSESSTENTNSVSSKIQTLISFVLASYISIVINRWDRIRNGTLGQFWGSFENILMMAFKTIQNVRNIRLRELRDKSLNNKHNRKAESEIIQQCQLQAARLLRYGRLSMQLLFLAAQGSEDFKLMYELGLLAKPSEPDRRISEEEKWLRAAAIGTRPLIVVGWLQTALDKLSLNPVDLGTVVAGTTGMRGGIGGTLGAIGAQLPYQYVFVLSWCVQILLNALAVETGVQLAVNTFQDKNGAGQYSPPDDNVHWPENRHIWYLNNFLATVCSNVVYALFAEGMLRVCDRLANPMSTEETSFSERLYDSFMHNNARALWVGFDSYDNLPDEDDLMGDKKSIDNDNESKDGA